jgi:hypothetical protein
MLARLKYMELRKFCFEVEVTIGKVRSYKRPGNDQITVEFDSCRRGGSMCSEIYIK